MPPPAYGTMFLYGRARWMLLCLARDHAAMGAAWWCYDLTEDRVVDLYLNDDTFVWL